MLQATESLPDVPRVPAPWSLRGHAWMVAMRLPSGDPARTAFVAPGLQATVKAAFSVLMCVVYEEAPCGPYRELLFIPGAFPFEDGRRHFTISRIVVSTWDSVVNGRNNWGIPKDRADFTVERAAGGRGQVVRVSSEGRELCELRFGSVRFAPPLPVFGGLLPAALRTLAQRFRDRTYYYVPEARGVVRPGRLLAWRFDPTLFPDLAGAAVLATFEVPSFRLVFPRADVR